MTEIIVREDSEEDDYFLLGQNGGGTTECGLRTVPNSNTSWRSLAGWKRRTVWANFCKRLPKTKVVFYLLLLNFLQSYGYFIASDWLTLKSSVQKMNWSDSKIIYQIPLLVKIGFPSLFYPLGGIIGDVYLGRRTLSLICLYVSWSMYLLLTVFLVVCGYQQFDNSLVFHVIIPLALLVVIGVADGVFQINWLTFGCDQLCNAPSEQVSSFIYYWYWSKNVGLVLAVLTNAALADITLDLVGKGSFSPLLAAIALTVALLMYNVHKGNFETERRNTNPISQVCGVLCNAASSRPRHQFISAFRYGEDPPSGLDYARQYHSGKYTDEQVQDVRTCGQVMTLIATLSGFMATYTALLTMIDCQMKPSKQDNSRYKYLQHQVSSITADATVILLVPLWNNLVFPLMNHYLPNSRKRIGLGMAISTVALVAATLIYSKSSHRLWLLFPAIAIGIAETSVFIPILEFIYAQSPDNMKGLLIGCHYFLIGVWNAVAVVLFYVLQSKPNYNCQLLDKDNYKTTLWYYISFSIVSLIGLVLFCTVSCFYRNRQRNNPISDLLRISMYYK